MAPPVPESGISFGGLDSKVLLPPPPHAARASADAIKTTEIASNWLKVLLTVGAKLSSSHNPDARAFAQLFFRNGIAFSQNANDAPPAQVMRPRHVLSSARCRAHVGPIGEVWRVSCS